MGLLVEEQEYYFEGAPASTHTVVLMGLVKE
jgi:hypothetical protein